MRNFIISVVLCAVPMMSFAECDNPVLTKIASSVHPKQKVYEGFTSCKKMPNNPELTIFAEVLEKAPNGSEDAGFGYYDLSLVIAKSDSGEIVGRYFKNDFYNMGNGGITLNEIKVDTANYRFNAETRAFGLASQQGGRDGAFEQITLYVLKGNQIIPVLNNLELVSSPSNTSFDCNVADSDTKRTIVMSTNATNGFFDILVNEKKVKYKVTKKSCDTDKPKVESTSTKKYTLKYDDKKGAYDAPEEIAMPDLN